MNTVQPIKDFDLILDMMDYFKARNERDYVLFNTGIYAPIRISDILYWKVRDVRNKEYISLRERKTEKEQFFPINTELRKVFNKYIEGKKDYEYLFASRQKNRKGIYAPISRQQAYNIINKAAKEFGLQKIGCHTMRKTFGFHYYQQTGDIVTLQEIFNHDDIKTTKIYIGLNQQMKDEAIRSFMYKRLRKQIV